MPYKNKTKRLYEGGIYHAYNRGVRKQEVFLDSQDYRKFLHFLKLYIVPDYCVRARDITFNSDKNKFENIYKLTNEVQVFAFCLMPNHFHLLLRQTTKKGMPHLIARISSRYSRYFNEKYTLAGPLWVDNYKAVEVKNEVQFNTVIKYIHDNPLELGEDIYSYPYSSLKYYIEGRYNKFIKWGRPPKYYAN